MASATQQVHDINLEITRFIRAPRARVFAAWTNPAGLQSWYSPGNMVLRNVQMDVREGGCFSFEMAGDITPATAEDFEVKCTKRSKVCGKYTRVVQNKLLQFTWEPEWAPGESNIVTVTLSDMDGGTEITLLHERFGSEDRARGTSLGWTSILAKLAALISD